MFFPRVSMFLLGFLWFFHRFFYGFSRAFQDSVLEWWCAILSFFWTKKPKRFLYVLVRKPG